MTKVVEALHPSMVEVRDRLLWPLGPCSESAGGGSSDWRGNLVVDSRVSQPIGLGLPINHLQHSHSLQAGVDVGASNSLPLGCSDMIVF